MDKAKKKRTVERIAFTKSLKAFDEAYGAHGVSHATTVIAYKILEDKMQSLTTTTEAAMELLLDEEDSTDSIIEKEYDEASEYRAKFITAKVKFENSVAQLTPTLSATASTPQINVSAAANEYKPYKLPTIEFVKFSGDLRGWLEFWSQFKKIHEDTSIMKEDKFQYLVQAMIPGSRAAELVKSFPPTAENYDQVIDSLKNRFGRDDLQIEVHVRDLLQLVLRNAITPSKEVVLSSLYDQIESRLRALNSLGVTTDKCAAMLFPLVESSLPEELLRAWQRSAPPITPVSTSGPSRAATTKSVDARAKNRLTQLMQFLTAEFEGELRITMAVEGFNVKPKNESADGKSKQDKQRNNKDVTSATALLTTKNRTKECLFCSASEHESTQCEQAKKMSLSERQDIVKKKNACFNCLNVGHSYKKCRVNIKCAWCSRKHVLLMCAFMTDKCEESKEPRDSKTTKTMSNCNLTNSTSDNEVLLQTLRVVVYNGSERTYARAIIDSGSQRSYITKEAANRVKYKPVGEQLLCHSLFGGKTSGTQKHKKYEVHISSINGQYTCEFTALDQLLICESVPAIKRDQWCNELKALKLDIPDVGAHNEPISLLIGADIAGKLITGRRHALECGLVAIETYLGWTIMGAVKDSEPREDAALMTRTMFVNSQVVEDLWALDVLGIKDPIEQRTLADREKAIKQMLLDSTTVNDEKRYEVQLPWLENHPPLCENTAMARKRLEATIKQLKSDGLYEAYDGVFNEWLADGVIERVPEEEICNKGHYLPHRAVIKNKTTTIRPIFDASAAPKTDDGKKKLPSLNDCSEKGPNLLELISTILLHFREGKIGVISDIKKAFLQISVKECDRDFLRFLWQGNQIVFRHRRVVFGVSSSPFILGAVLVMHLEKILSGAGNEFEFSEQNIVKLQNSFYVDNCVTSVNCENELHSFIRDARAAMELGKFDLRGWEFTNDDNSVNPTAVLGLVWNKRDDTLSLNMSCTEKLDLEKITKRTILSAAHRVYDPLGFVCPAVLCPRLLLQETWAQKLSWDEEVSNEIKSQFIKWVENLKELENVKIPRCFLGVIKEEDKISLHTFVDASQAAYAAVIFLRVENNAGIKVYFVQAKTRVAPTRKEGTDARTSIPRLELLAASIGARLTQSVLKSLSMKVDDIYFWSDSTTVLAWIHRESNWATFVWNRVKEIRSLSNPEQWRHVPGHLNPADLPSRGCTVDQLLIFRWWEGPQWLKLESENWTVTSPQYDESAINEELKKSVQKTNTLISIEKADWHEKISDFEKTKRVLAYVFRFFNNAMSKADSKNKFKIKLLRILKMTNELRVYSHLRIMKAC